MKRAWWGILTTALGDGDAVAVEADTFRRFGLDAGCVVGGVGCVGDGVLKGKATLFADGVGACDVVAVVVVAFVAA